MIPFTQEDIIDTDINDMKIDFKEKIQSTIGNYTTSIINASELNTNNIYEDLFFPAAYDTPNDVTEPQETDTDSNPILRPNMDNLHDEPYAEIDDKFLGQTLQLPLNDEMTHAKVIRGKRRNDGSLIGIENSIPILDTRIFEIEHADGSISEYNTNVLLENLYEQVDDNGNQYNIFDSIIDHRKNDDAISKEDGYIISQNGVRRKIITTKGWELNVRWKDGSESWIPMNEIKESNPLEVAEYSISRIINNEPAFSWWVATILNKRNRIINKVKSRIKIKNLKY